MSSEQTQRQITQLNNDIVRLEQKIASLAKDESNKTNQILSVQKSINKNTSSSSLQSKARQIDGYNRDIQRILSSKSSVSKDLATKKKRVAELTTRLFKEQAEETKKSQREQKSLNDAYKKQITDLTSRLENQYNELTSEAVNVNIGNEDDANDEYDVFISHATEDKESFVNELHRILTEEYGLKVWYDAIEMKWGDSLRSRIDNGLRKSKFGIVVLSNHYISKGWTQYELDGLFQKEIGADKVILPIWHNITRAHLS